MGYINVFVSSSAALSVKNKQLKVAAATEEGSYPLEDVNCVLLESHACTLSSYVLDAFAENGILLITCDGMHMPNAALVPFAIHYKQYAVLKTQLSLPKPVAKRLWQKIVVRKILNQAECLALFSRSAAVRLTDIARGVQSGDAGNAEAAAANIYFKALFGETFVRREENLVNAMLNYAYSLLRSLVARTLAVYGFNMCLGLHHKNELNAFNLADDLIEPFRPVADLLVCSVLRDDIREPSDEELTPVMKRRLFALLNADTEIDGGIYSLSYAVELTVQSLAKCYKESTFEYLKLPGILKPNMHSYE